MADLPPRPAFTGLVVHRDVNAGFSLLVPDGWQRSNATDRSGALYTPDPDDPTTGLEVAAQDLGTEVDARDLPALRRGFVSGLRTLPGCQIEQQEAAAAGSLLTLEARVTYRDGEATRKRWVRLLYDGQRQLRLLAEGSSVERFAYWEPMFFTAFRTVRFGDWWSEATGAEWEERLLREGAEASQAE